MHCRSLKDQEDYPRDAKEFTGFSLSLQSFISYVTWREKILFLEHSRLLKSGGATAVEAKPRV